MKPAPFSYHAPTTTREAVSLLADFQEEGRVLAGGQSLIPLMNFRLAQPAHLVDVNPLVELDYIRTDDGWLAVGARTRQSALEASPEAAQRAPLLTEAIKLVAHPPIRHRGTVGGSIAHADPAAELPTVALAMDWEMIVASTKGLRTVTAAEFFKGPYATALGSDELLAECRFKAWPAKGTGHAFMEMARTHANFAIVGAAVLLHLEDGKVDRAAIAVCGLAGTPLRATGAENVLTGASPTKELLDEAAGAAVAGLTPASDIHGGSSFRLKVGRVYVRRALELALGRARGEQR